MRLMTSFGVPLRLPWARLVPALLVVLSTLTLVSAAASAQAQRDRLPAPEANLSRPTHPNNALFIPRGHLQLGLGYFANFFEGMVPTHHTLDFTALSTVTDLVEARIRWSLVNSAGIEAGLGDLMVGMKGGFFGGFDESTSIAGVFEMTLPTGDAAFGLGTGVGLFSAVVATQRVGTLDLDLQVGLDTHLFIEDPTVLLPISAALTWHPIDELSVMGDGVITLDLENLSDSRTSFMAGCAYRMLPQLAFDAGARLGLSPELPDASLTLGITWLTGPLF